MTNNKCSVFEQHYEIVSVARTGPPLGAVGDNWHRYVIAQGEHVISGHRQGSLNAVTKTAQEYADQLNHRRMGKSGRMNQVSLLNKRSHK